MAVTQVFYKHKKQPTILSDVLLRLVLQRYVLSISSGYNYCINVKPRMMMICSSQKTMIKKAHDFALGSRTRQALHQTTQPPPHQNILRYLEPNHPKESNDS